MENLLLQLSCLKQHLGCNHLEPASEQEGVTVILPGHVQVEQEIPSQLVAVQVLG